MFHRRRASTSSSMLAGYQQQQEQSSAPTLPTQNQPTTTQSSSVVGAHKKKYNQTCSSQSRRGDSFFSVFENVHNNMNDDDDDDDNINNKYTTKMSMSMMMMMKRHTFILYRRIIPCFILMILPWIPSQRIQWQIQSRQVQLQTMVQDQKDLVQRLDDVTANMKELRKEIELLTKDNDLSFQAIHRNGREISVDVESETYAEIEKEEEALVKRIESLERAIQKSSEKRLYGKYGSGSYRIRVNVRDENGETSYFVIETALSMEMPHAIDYFLRMVERKLWDGLALVHEVNSKFIMAKPIIIALDNDNNNSHHTWAGERFVNANLTHMAFNEFSPSFPLPHHRKFSVAFSGRPGGPNFYINLDNESEFAHEHESTFGVVLEGRDVLMKLSMKPFGYYDDESKHMLTIDTMEVLSLPESQGGGPK